MLHLTLIQDDRQLEALVRDVESKLAGVNKRAAATQGLLPIAGCELVSGNVTPAAVAVDMT